MEKLIVEEICKNLKWHEKIIVTIFKRTFIKTYNVKDTSECLYLKDTILK